MCFRGKEGQGEKLLWLCLCIKKGQLNTTTDFHLLSCVKLNCFLKGLGILGLICDKSLVLIGSKKERRTFDLDGWMMLEYPNSEANDSQIIS